MKNYIKKSRSFTLVELLISVTIFIVVIVVVVSVLSMTISTKSKLKSIDDLRIAGGQVMAEIQDVVERGNLNDASHVAVVIKPNNVYTATSSCTNLAADSTPDGLGSFYQDAQGIITGRDIWLDTASGRIRELKDISGHGSSTNFITPNSLTVTKFNVSGLYRDLDRAACSKATTITVELTIQGKTTGNIGSVPSLTLQSTFTPKYPGPDLAGDSI